MNIDGFERKKKLALFYMEGLKHVHPGPGSTLMAKNKVKGLKNKRKLFVFSFRTIYFQFSS